MAKPRRTVMPLEYRLASVNVSFYAGEINDSVEASVIPALVIPIIYTVHIDILTSGHLGVKPGVDFQ